MCKITEMKDVHKMMIIVKTYKFLSSFKAFLSKLCDLKINFFSVNFCKKIIILLMIFKLKNYFNHQ